MAMYKSTQNTRCKQLESPIDFGHTFPLLQQRYTPYKLTRPDSPFHRISWNKKLPIKCIIYIHQERSHFLLFLEAVRATLQSSASESKAVSRTSTLQYRIKLNQASLLFWLKSVYLIIPSACKEKKRQNERMAKMLLCINKRHGTRGLQFNYHSYNNFIAICCQLHTVTAK